ncbi:hypothetical protein FNV43_RR00325 [Rhamnella rubrinervis]|uniref:Apple domain-containing protein n=1 Tax=Rhamnella rubrinervis TaxID=2594499 RepID=A0A8K0HQD5_9ROSA|nr:hypothetical protein FNV43_RR00325 [Rhamnella rubrinervis]
MSILSRIIVGSGFVQRTIRYDQEHGWREFMTSPDKPCDQYGHCGASGSLIWSKGEGFVKLENVKVPDTSNVVVINGLSLEECKKECLRSCNCTAYASANISKGGNGCIAWHGDLVDTRIFTAGGQDFYLRIDKRELAQYAKKSKDSVATKWIRITMTISLLGICLDKIDLVPSIRIEIESMGVPVEFEGCMENEIDGEECYNDVDDNDHLD